MGRRWGFGGRCGRRFRGGVEGGDGFRVADQLPGVWAAALRDPAGVRDDAAAARAVFGERTVLSIGAVEVGGEDLADAVACLWSVSGSRDIS